MEGEQYEALTEREQPQPKIYAACLAAYNHGVLHGEWIHADQEPDYLHAEILDMLEASPVPGGEEWAIHDYEGFGAFDLHEHEDLATVARVASGIVLHGTAFSHWIQEVGSETEDALETFPRNVCSGLNGCVNACAFTAGVDLLSELQLQNRVAAGSGHATARGLVEGAIAQDTSTTSPTVLISPIITSALA